jgi:hypothetical protein
MSKYDVIAILILILAILGDSIINSYFGTSVSILLAAWAGWTTASWVMVKEFNAKINVVRK